jgi:hypothetical protein
MRALATVVLMGAALSCAGGGLPAAAQAQSNPGRSSGGSRNGSYWTMEASIVGEFARYGVQ